jgi:hypothetical protein
MSLALGLNQLIGVGYYPLPNPGKQSRLARPYTVFGRKSGLDGWQGGVSLDANSQKRRQARCRLLLVCGGVPARQDPEESHFRDKFTVMLCPQSQKSANRSPAKVLVETFKDDLEAAGSTLTLAADIGARGTLAIVGDPLVRGGSESISFFDLAKTVLEYLSNNSISY